MLARPVRRPAEIALEAFDRARHAPLDVGLVVFRHDQASLLHYRLHALAREHAREIALFADREDHDRDVVVAAQRHGGSVHDLQIVCQNFVITDCFKTFCARILLGIAVIDPVDAGALEQRIALHFGGPQRGAGIGGEVRRANAGGEDHHAALSRDAARPGGGSPARTPGPSGSPTARGYARRSVPAHSASPARSSPSPACPCNRPAPGPCPAPPRPCRGRCCRRR